MYRLVTILSLFTVLALGATAAQPKDQELFPYPVPPDEMELLDQRCNYLVDNFWKRCEFKTAFSSVDRLNKAFGDWVQFMPHASADTVHMAIDNLLYKLKKNAPYTLKMAEIAEGWLYSDTSEIRSEELYLPFAQAVVNHKKIGKADKMHYASQVKVIESSAVGAHFPDITLTRPDGSKLSLADIKAEHILLFVNDPGCDDCRMARLRMSIDYGLGKLVDDGAVAIVSIYPGEAKDSEWLEAVGDYPEKWTVVACEDIDNYADISLPPTFIYLNGEHVVRVKDMPVDNVLRAFNLLYYNQKK